MRNQLQTFAYESSNVRVVMKGGQPWFVAKDVCELFGDTNRNRTMQSLDDDEKGYTQMNTPGGTQEVAIVNESGLYSMLFSMQPKKARNVSDQHIEERIRQLKQFRHWVTHEVLPSIRKNGLYATPEAAEKLLNDPDFLIQALQELKAIREKNNALAKTVAIQDQQITEMNPKATYYDIVLQTPDLLPIVKIAKDYGKSAQWMNDMLHLLGVQYKRGDTWLLYQQHAEQGYTKSRTITYTDSQGVDHSKLHTYWTQKGRLFIYDLLKQKGHLPLIEQPRVS